MYTEAPSEALPLLKMFSFDVSKCSSYRLGSADIRVSTAENNNNSGIAVGGSAGGALGEEGGAPTSAVPATGAPAYVGELLSRIETLEAEMLKMQGMILLHDGQLQTLPGYPVAADTGGML
jgi:hypothetical protein